MRDPSAPYSAYFDIKNEETGEWDKIALVEGSVAYIAFERLQSAPVQSYNAELWRVMAFFMIRLIKRKAPLIKEEKTTKTINDPVAQKDP